MAIERLRYTKRDLDALDLEITKFITAFFPSISDPEQDTAFRTFLRLVAGLIDSNNFSIDVVMRELNLVDVELRKNAVIQAQSRGYYPTNIESAKVDLTFTPLVEPVVAPIPINIYDEVDSDTSPTVRWYLAESGAIPVGTGVSETLSAVQGIRVLAEVLSANASGDLDQRYTLQFPNAPEEFIVVRVAAVQWERKGPGLFDSGPTDQHYWVEYEEDGTTVIRFSVDGVHGAIPDGVAVDVDYVRSVGASGNLPKNSITKILTTPLKNNAAVTNLTASSGGDDFESLQSIKRNAPNVVRSRYRAVTEDDFVALATTVAGVAKASVAEVIGSFIRLHVVPNGGGQAPQFILDATKNFLDTRAIVGRQVEVLPVFEAFIRMQLNVYTQTNLIDKSLVEARVQDAILAQLQVDQLKIGRAFRVSDITALIEQLDSGQTVDYLDTLIFTRIPRPSKSNETLPDIIGDIDVRAAAGYDEWILQATTTSAFTASLNGIVEAGPGTVGVQYAPANDAVRFTWGNPGDVLIPGETLTFTTSPLNGNISIGDDEVMALRSFSDLAVSVFHPGEGDFIG